MKIEFSYNQSNQKNDLEEKEIIKAEPNSLFDICCIITLIQNQWNGVGNVINTLCNSLTITVLYSQSLRVQIWCCETMLTRAYTAFLYKLMSFPVSLPTLDSSIITSSPSPVERVFKLQGMKTDTSCMCYLSQDVSWHFVIDCSIKLILSRILNIFQAKAYEKIIIIFFRIFLFIFFSWFPYLSVMTESVIWRVSLMRQSKSPWALNKHSLGFISKKVTQQQSNWEWICLTSPASHSEV